MVTSGMVLEFFTELVILLRHLNVLYTVKHFMVVHYTEMEH